MAIVHIDASTLVRSRSGSVTGKIWLQIGDEAFPEAGWSDFPVVILGWWMQGLSKLLFGAETSVDCLFMDGPLAFSLTRVSSDLLEIRAGQRDGDRSSFGCVGMDDFVADIRRSGEQVLRACVVHGWNSRDIDFLRREVEDFRRTLGN